MSEKTVVNGEKYQAQVSLNMLRNLDLHFVTGGETATVNGVSAVMSFLGREIYQDTSASCLTLLRTQDNMQVWQPTLDELFTFLWMKRKLDYDNAHGDMFPGAYDIPLKYGTQARGVAPDFWTSPRAFDFEFPGVDEPLYLTLSPHIQRLPLFTVYVRSDFNDGCSRLCSRFNQALDTLSGS